MIASNGLVERIAQLLQKAEHTARRVNASPLARRDSAFFELVSGVTCAKLAQHHNLEAKTIWNTIDRVNSRVSNLLIDLGREMSDFTFTEIKDASTLQDVVKLCFEYPEEDLLGLAYQSVRVAHARRRRGEFYTPRKVADYIVSCGFSNFGDIASTQKILDPSCGSGVFILSVLDFLQKRSNKKHLKSILPRIYGYDIEGIPTKLCKINIALTLDRYGISDYAEPKIIDRDFLAGELSEQFDLIVGNPPYVGTHARPKRRQYEHFFLTAKGNYDVYCLFIEQAIRSLTDNGVASLIVPNKWIHSNYGAEVRKLLSTSCSVYLVNLGLNKVFDSLVDTCILIAKKSPLVPRSLRYRLLPPSQDVLSSLCEKDEGLTARYDLSDLGSSKWLLAPEDLKGIVTKILEHSKTLSDIGCHIFQGLVPGAYDVFDLELKKRSRSECRVYSDALKKEYVIETELLKPLLRASHIRRFHLRNAKRVLLFPYRPSESRKMELIPLPEIVSTYPSAWAYLSDARRILEGRERGKLEGSQRWHGFIYPKNLSLVSTRGKILVGGLTVRAGFAYDDDTFFFLGRGDGGYGIILSPLLQLDGKAICSVLNSTIVDCIHHLGSSRLEWGNYSYGKRFIVDLPVPKSLEKDHQQELSALYDELSSAYRNEDEKAAIKLEEHVDEIVSVLFGIDSTERHTIKSYFEFLTSR